VIGFGVVFGARDQLTTGTLLAFLFLVNLLTEPVQMIVEASDSAQAAGAGLRKVLAVIDEPVDLPDAADPQSLPAGYLAVEAVDTTFQYPTGPPIIQNLNLTIAPGERVAVVGQTGSGKTTFAKLIARLIDPTGGVITVGGVDLRNVAFADLRTRVSYVPQQGFLFNTSLLENIRYGRSKATDTEVHQAIADLNLGDWVDGLPDGLSTVAGVRGQNLSAGERQLVALTRAWVANPDLLILDEATSAVDPALELKLRDAIERLAQGRTSITVAHRLSTAEAADRVLVFDAGHIVEDGTHAELVGVGGVYASLHADWAVATR
jgi:putative ABC transport system ATP-binding protein